ncbi:hypothetical protein PHYBOEH_007812 [Phytophthora boehmeriae]|uniref:RxLR effector protein n=1 Tax=Phytophthora boehmeriae TaxID=109152 RepID=A0A8T1X6Z4_9STRA|nr:hypothetical protein PHYBOEH_007812 [Phytophthora boehmeriae]
MRLQYFLLVGAATLLATVDGVAARTSSAHTSVSTVTTADIAPAVRSLATVEANEGNNKRLLRRSNEGQDDDDQNDENQDDGDLDDEDEDQDEEEEERMMNTSGLKKWVKGVETKEGREQKAKKVRDEKTVDDMLAEGILNPELLKYMKDQNMITSKKFSEMEKKLNGGTS